MWVHFVESHEPYVAHPEFAFGAGDMDRYDSEIAYVDAAIGRLRFLRRERRTRSSGQVDSAELLC